MVSVTGHTEPVTLSIVVMATIASGTPSSMVGVTTAAAATASTAPLSAFSPTPSSLSSLSLSSSSPPAAFLLQCCSATPFSGCRLAVGDPLAAIDGHPARFVHLLHYKPHSTSSFSPNLSPRHCSSPLHTLTPLGHRVSRRYQPRLRHLLFHPWRRHGASSTPPTFFSLSSLPPSHFLSNPAGSVAAAGSSATGSSTGAPPFGAYPPASASLHLPPLHFNPHPQPLYKPLFTKIHLILPLPYKIAPHFVPLFTLTPNTSYFYFSAKKPLNSPYFSL